MFRSLLRPMAYLVAILAWLFVMSLPVLAFLIATRGQIQLGADAQSNVRLFLVQEENVQGLGVEWSRRDSDSRDCARTTVKYLLWQGGGSGQNVEYCRCFDPATNQPQESRPCPEL